MFRLKKRRKKGVEIIEVIIALAVIGITAVTVTKSMSGAMKKNSQTVINATDLSTQPVN